MPGLTHLRFDHVRQIYIGQIEIMNIGNTSFSFEKGSTVAKHIYVTEEDAEQTIAKPLDKRPVGECFKQLSKKLHQKGSDKGMYKDKLVNPELQPQEDCHGMAKHMHNQGNQEFSGEIAFCAQCSLANILLRDGQKNLEEDEKMIPEEYEEFAKKTGLTLSDLNLDQTIQLCKLFEKYKEMWDILNDAPIVHTDATEFRIELNDKNQEPFRHTYRTKDMVKRTIEEKQIQEMAKRRVI